MKKAVTAGTSPALHRPSAQGTRRRMPRILVAEDDVEMRHLLVSRLRHAGFETIECADGYQLLDQLGDPVLSGEPDEYDLIVSDIRMPGVTGLEVLEGIHEAEWFVPMILITAFGNDQVHQEAEQYGAAAVFDKPFDIDTLIERIRQVLVLDHTRGDNWSLGKIKRERVVGVPVDVVFSGMPSLNHVWGWVEKAAKILEPLGDRILYCRAVVLRDGDNGTGRYAIQVMVTLTDRVFVVRSNLKSIKTEADLYEAIPKAFEVTYGKIRKHLGDAVD
jgi:CheY-like chemotaxis protein